MRELFTIDSHNYPKDCKRYYRPSARSIIIKDGLIAMVYSRKYNYYKFPGGGIEPGESKLEAVIRETKEEAGLIVLPDTVREYGVATLIRYTPEKRPEVFVQENYYYLCAVSDEKVQQELDDYESDEGFSLVYVCPKVAIAANQLPDHGPKSPGMVAREARVLSMLIEEGYFG